MSENAPVAACSLLRQGLALARAAEPRARPSRRAIVIDAVFAANVLAAALIATHLEYDAQYQAIAANSATGMSPLSAVRSTADVPWLALVAAMVASVPLAVRRLVPLSAFAVLLVGVLATRRYATDVTFMAVICAGYSAIAHSRFRNAAIFGVPLGGLILAAVYWTTSQTVEYPPGSAAVRVVYPGNRVVLIPREPKLSRLREQPFGGPKSAGRAAPVLKGSGIRGHALGGPYLGGSGNAWRGVAVLVLVALVAIAVIRNAMRARETRSRLEAEHEAATRRAVERERTRIASELHDVVTHNVSVMIVQAGAARQVLGQSPGEARSAMLAVEASGRAAMTELRHLLGLLTPGGPGSGQAGGDVELRPQPGLAQLRSLVDRVAGTGLPVELYVADDVPVGLPPGLDLAAFRVVQEALTNVLKHAGKPPTSVSIDCQDGDLLVEVSDAGPPIPAAVPAMPGGGRGLIGLRERAGLYGGRLEAGPRPGGGWQVQARFPVDPGSAAPAADGANDTPEFAPHGVGLASTAVQAR